MIIKVAVVVQEHPPTGKFLSTRWTSLDPPLDDVHSVLLISSAHNKWGPPRYKHCPNFELKRRVYIHLQAWQTRKVLDIQLVYIIFYKYIAVQNVNKVRTCAHEWTSSLNYFNILATCSNMVRVTVLIIVKVNKTGNMLIF